MLRKMRLGQKNCFLIKETCPPGFNKLTAENSGARLAQANLIRKANFDAKLSSLIKNYFK